MANPIGNMREMWTATCVVTGEEMMCGRPNDMTECRHPNRFCCTNFMHHYVKGVNCKLKLYPGVQYDLGVLPSRLETEVERLKDYGTVRLAAMFKETEERYLELDAGETKTQLRATLGAITVILTERGERKSIYKNIV